MRNLKAFLGLEYLTITETQSSSDLGSDWDVLHLELGSVALLSPWGKHWPAWAQCKLSFCVCVDIDPGELKNNHLFDNSTGGTGRLHQL